MRLVIWTLTVLWLILFFYQRYIFSKQIENLNKQIELLECYRDNYLMMADSMDNIHAHCFKLGEQ